MNQVNVTSQKRKQAPPVNPVFEVIKIVVGSGFGLFFAVLLLSYFWGIDLLGMQGRAKRSAELASASPPAPQQPAPPAAPQPAANQPQKITPPSLTPDEIRAAASRAPARAPAPEPDPAATPTHQPTSPPDLGPTEPEPAISQVAEQASEQASEPARESVAPSCPEPAPMSASLPDPKSPKGAWLVVNRMRPWQIPREVGVPDSLKSGISFVWQEKPRSAKMELGDLEFQVTKTGLVMLAENWKSQGGGGDWQKTALDREKLIQNGWQPCGTINWPPVPAEETQELELFQKVCQKGETYKIRTNKYWPPFVFLPPSK